MKKARIIIRSLYVTLAVLVMALVMLVVTLPQTSRWGTIRWLEVQGVVADIEAVTIDWMDGRISISNMTGRKGEDRVIAVEQLAITFDWQALRERRLQLESVMVQGLELEIVKEASGQLRVAGVLLPAEQPSQAPVKEAPGEESPGWAFQLDQLSLDNFRIGYLSEAEGTNLSVRWGKLGWQGDFRLPPVAAGSEPALTVNGNVQLDDFQLDDRRGDQTVILNQRLELQALSLQGVEAIAAAEIHLAGFHLFPSQAEKGGPSSLFRMDRLRLVALEMGVETLGIQRLEIEGLGGKLEKDREGGLVLRKRFDQVFAAPVKTDVAEVAAEETQASATGQRTFRLGELNLVKSHEIEIIDKSQARPFRASLRFNQLQLVSVDSAQPGNRSPLNLDLVLNQHGHARVKGKLALFSPTQDFELESKLTGIDLRPANPMIEKELGYLIRSGQMDAEIEMQSKQKQLKGVMKLDLQHLVLKRLDQHQAGKQNAGSQKIPLDSALNLLRDRNDRIRLKIPVSGDTSKPDFDVQDAIYQASSKAMMSAIVNYYTPFGLVTVTQGLYEMVTAMRFEPVVFAAGSSSIPELQHEPLQGISRMLKERPGIHVKVCGFTAKEDLKQLAPEEYNRIEQKQQDVINEATEHQLRELANLRGERVKQFLVDQDIAASRLVLCEPEHRSQEVAGVEIGL